MASLWLLVKVVMRTTCLIPALALLAAGYVTTRVPRGRQQQVVCFCPDSILVRSARNMRHVMPAAAPPPQPQSSSSSSPTTSSHLPVRGGRWGGGGREGGRERPPSLGSQPLNQTLSHPVNLKQSGFNSSCLSAAALAKTTSGSQRRADRLRPLTEQNRTEQRRQAWGCSKGHMSKDMQGLLFSPLCPPATLFSPHPLAFSAILQGSQRDDALPSDRWCQGLVFEGYFGSSDWVCVVFKLLQGFIPHCVSSFTDIAHWDRSEWIFGPGCCFGYYHWAKLYPIRAIKYHIKRPQLSSMQSVLRCIRLDCCNVFWG